jgi:NADPH-ferrihemoprotein reductase
VRVFLRPSDNFGPPKDLSTPLVMIGPGTGVAPFRGFLQQRRAAATAAAGGDPAVALGEAWLYFGCRRRDEDYLYGAELEAFEASGDLARLRVAFSREGAAKEYVQHLMARDGAALAKLVLQDGAHVFVCGDGAAMAKDVHAALAGALRDYGGLGEAEAEAQLKTMAASGAYVRDVWCA